MADYIVRLYGVIEVKMTAETLEQANKPLSCVI